MSQKGFTLIELLVVISIIGLLSSVVLASLNGARQKARDARRKSDLKQLAIVNELYFDAEGNENYIGLTGWFSNTVQYGGTNPAFNSVIPKYISKLSNDPLYPSSGYSYLTKNWNPWAGCGGGSNCCPNTNQNGFILTNKKYAFYAKLEQPTAADLATMSDAYDKCNAEGWGFNYRYGN